MRAEQNFDIRTKVDAFDGRNYVSFKAEPRLSVIIQYKMPSKYRQENTLGDSFNKDRLIAKEQRRAGHVEITFYLCKRLRTDWKLSDRHRGRFTPQLAGVRVFLRFYNND